MQEVIRQLRGEGYDIRDDDLKHLGPARHEHINPYGHYSFNVQEELERKGYDRYEMLSVGYFSFATGRSG